VAVTCTEGGDGCLGTIAMRLIFDNGRIDNAAELQ